MSERPSLPGVLVRAGLSLVPGIGGALAELAAYAQELDKLRVAEMANQARDAVGDDDQFLQALRSDNRLLDMLRDAGDASGRTEWQAKRRAMGRVLGQAALDDAQVDELAMMLAALEALEPIHYRYLSQLEEAPEAPFQNLDEDRLVPEPYRSHLLAAGVVSVHTIWGGNASRGGASLIGVNDLEFDFWSGFGRVRTHLRLPARDVTLNDRLQAKGSTCYLHPRPVRIARSGSGPLDAGQVGAS